LGFKHADYWIIYHSTIAELKVVKVTQTKPTPFQNSVPRASYGTGLKIIIHISIFNLQKDWRFIGQKDLLRKHVIPFIPTWKTCTHNTNMH
jgi:hypothetical protein